MKLYEPITRFGWLLLVLTGLALGQSFTAAVRGVVTDPTSSAVPNAKVVFTEVARNVQHTAVTDSQGRYQLNALPPGQYTMTVEAQGFKKHLQTAFPLVVQQQATLDVQMAVGEVSSTVEVTDGAPLLNTTIANLGQVIENKYILSLPNIARNSMSLVI